MIYKDIYKLLLSGETKSSIFENPGLNTKISTKKNLARIIAQFPSPEMLVKHDRRLKTISLFLFLNQFFVIPQIFGLMINVKLLAIGIAYTFFLMFTYLNFRKAVLAFHVVSLCLSCLLLMFHCVCLFLIIESSNRINLNVHTVGTVFFLLIDIIALYVGLKYFKLLFQNNVFSRFYFRNDGAVLFF